MTNPKKDIYADAAASSLKPAAVIAAQLDFLQNHYANAGRSICARAAYADKMVADARAAVARFIGAESPNQIIFTNGATDGLNRIARMIAPGSIVAVSDLDHHSAREPFEQLHKTVPCDLDADLNIASVPKCDAVVITAMSNVTGVAQDVKKIVATAPGAITIVDAAQYAAHLPINVSDWGCDFLCFSGHKIGADTGVGVMYVREPARWATDRFGGGQFGARAGTPESFEAGTLPLSQIAGLHAAIAKDKKNINELLDYLRSELSKNPRIKFISPVGAFVLSFTIDNMNALDYGALMGARGVCLRVGNMCASWIHKRLGLPASIRISVGPWNTMDEMRDIIRITNEIIK